MWETLTNVGQEKSTILSKLESCIERMNTIHSRVNIIREKVSWESEASLEPTDEKTSIEWMVNALIDNIINLHEKVDTINEKL